MAGVRERALLMQKCPVCKAKPGEGCVNTITPGEPLPGRLFHFGRDGDES